MRVSKSLVLGAGFAAALAFAAGAWWLARDRAPSPHATPTASVPPAPVATYVGGARCAACHADEYRAWQGSQHAQAMQIANDRTVLGDFSGVKFNFARTTSTFFRRDGKYFVNTDGPEGKLADFEIRYTFGVAPLQQYLIALPGGRLQALGIAWDARPKTEGGQRWFHLYPDLKPKAGDPLHWTGIDQNWNYQCADCHSTNLRKGYDEASRTFKTTWTDIDVACEACHGPGSNHVAWAKMAGARADGKGAMGLDVALDERHGAAWAMDPARGTAKRSKPRDTSREIDVCARCHARRGQFSDAWRPGEPLGDAYRVSLLEPPLYFVDGQKRGEVYTYASFLQSKMYAQGVTCSDCHDPHSGKTRSLGNAVCAQCHLPAKYDEPAHTHHAQGSKGAQCAACHMPVRTYMLVDPRHDHSFRIPRPDRTIALGVPNACNGCHAGRSAKWAASTVARWFPKPNPGYQDFAERFEAADRGAPGAARALARMVTDGAQPAIVRASALQRLAHDLDQTTLPAVRDALGDADATVRAAAADALANADPATRARLLARALADPVRLVRMDAARALAGAPEAMLSADDRRRFDHALDEYVAAQRFDADRPEAHGALGTLYATRGRAQEAAAEYRRALEIDDAYVPAALNLADLQRALGQDSEAERTLRAVLARAPQSAVAHHALGLTLVRQKRTREALAELARATKLAPDNARFAYVYGVALYDSGARAKAIETLQAALREHPYDRETLFALALYQGAAGDLQQARAHARVLLELEPDNRDVVELARRLGGDR
jgi:tetratricopeptide (TPR) repeat protein